MRLGVVLISVVFVDMKSVAVFFGRRRRGGHQRVLVVS
jgi:hypothetical protein